MQKVYIAKNIISAYPQFIAPIIPRIINVKNPKNSITGARNSKINKYGKVILPSLLYFQLPTILL